MNLLNKCIILTLCILLIENGFCGSNQKMFEKSNLGIQIALNDELNGLDSVQILQKLLNEKSEPANFDQYESASGSDQTKVGEKPNSDLKAHHPYSESNLGISNALNDGLSALEAEF
uniref:PIPK domain-containing protein n=1 Tax=Globodera rostochiensis TaxID=31243 RepID=A0A914IGH0_GLORO